MSPGTHVMLNCFLTMGLPVLWGVHELWALRRARSGGNDRRVVPPTPPKPLPDCLIPRPMARQRVLEDA